MQKKYFWPFVVFSLICVLTACFNQPTNDSTVNGSQPTNSESQPTVSNEDYVTDLMLDSDRKYTGAVNNGIPEGKGCLVWVKTNCEYVGDFKNGVYDGEGIFYWHTLGDKLEGTFENGAPTYGKYTYQTTMSYVGEFNSNWQFHGEGTFDWNTHNLDGSVNKYGWLYEGEFKNGTPVGCHGKVTFTDARYNELAEGVHYFIGEMNAFPGLKTNQYGTGKIIYGDKTIYEGEIYYSSTKQYLRYGQGTQYFYQSPNYNGATVGGDIDDLLYCYQGEFDAVNRAWIYGNGVMYICDEALNPVGYIKGQWNGMDRIADWQGDWNDDYLLEAYRNTDEISYTHGYVATLEGLVKKYKDTNLNDKTLLIGASHFTNWYSNAKLDLAPELDAVNFGIGGSMAKFWDDNFSYLEELTSDPKNILLSIGGNDISNRYTPDETKVFIQSVMEKLSAKFKTSKIIFVSMFDAPGKWNDWRLEDQKIANDLVKEYIINSTNQNLYYMDIVDFVYNQNATNGVYYDPNLGVLKAELFLQDKIHLTEDGYQEFAKAIKEGMNNLIN